MIDKKEQITADPENLDIATFAGGCFWCIEAAYDGMDGVAEAVSGYTGGTTENPSYEEVITGKTGHYETVQIKFDPQKISYQELLDIFWRQIDPTDDTGQFTDRGSQYRTVIFYHNPEQQDLAEKSKKTLEESGKFDEPIVTEILPAQTFYEADEYHQDYAKKRAEQYYLYKEGSGRNQILKDLWP